MKFSVIVPFLNEEKYIAQCIDALRNQTYSQNDFELIFVDNGSTDKSGEIVRSYSDIKYLLEEHKDAYVARNLGASKASGEILVFIDADCIASANLLSEYANAFSDTNVSLAFGRLSFPKNISRLLQYYEDYNRTKMRLMASSLPRESCYGHAGNMVIRASLFSDLGQFCRMPIVGDAEIVQKYFEHYPDDRFSYLDAAEVTHVEVESIWSLLKKL